VDAVAGGAGNSAVLEIVIKVCRRVGTVDSNWLEARF
jgi:hypothetical protein